MSEQHNTLLLRLAGVAQSWGTGSRLQLRRSQAWPSKSGVLGMLLCAMGVPREDSARPLQELNRLAMGLRIDHPGVMDWDYHTVGAGIGIARADGNGIKYTATTGEIEALISRRQYVYDASFLVALQGEAVTVARCREYLDGTAGPVWPVYLGRKSCVPSEPVLEGTGDWASLEEALSSVGWLPRYPEERPDSGTVKLDAVIEGDGEGSRLVNDGARRFGYFDYGPRWTRQVRVNAPVADVADWREGRGEYKDPYGSEWPELRRKRLDVDHGLCVFCKAPAVDVHHTDYEDVRPETLRSLCKMCHDACTMLEYASGRYQRVDPSDVRWRAALSRQIAKLQTDRREGRRHEMLEARSSKVDFFSDAAW